MQATTSRLAGSRAPLLLPLHGGGESPGLKRLLRHTGSTTESWLSAARPSPARQRQIGMSSVGGEAAEVVGGGTLPATTSLLAGSRAPLLLQLHALSSRAQILASVNTIIELESAIAKKEDSKQKERGKDSECSPVSD